MAEYLERASVIDALYKADAITMRGVQIINTMPRANVDMQTEPWHPITTRPMDEEERAYWSEQLGYALDDDEAVIYENLPDDGEEVIVSYKYGRVGVDTFCRDEGCYFEDNGDMDGIIAWMRFPAPYIPPTEVQNE